MTVLSGGCFETGGPDWLFSLTLGGGLAAALAAVYILALPTGHLTAANGRRAALLVCLFAVSPVLWGVPWVEGVVLVAPVLLMRVVAGLAVRQVVVEPDAEPAERGRANRWRVLLVVRGGAAAAAAIAAFTLNIVLGAPC